MIIGRRKEKQIDKIMFNTVEMFDIVIKQFEYLQNSIQNKDIDEAQKIIKSDLMIDELEVKITTYIQDFIIREQPMASDLRVALGTYAILIDLERLGDYTVNFAKHIVKYGEITSDHETDMLSIINKVIVQIVTTRDSYINIDSDSARKISEKDEEIDEAVKLLTKNIMRIIRQDSLEDSSEINLVILAKTLERSGDHIVNICEQVAYIDRGKRYNL